MRIWPSVSWLWKMRYHTPKQLTTKFLGMWPSFLPQSRQLSLKFPQRLYQKTLEKQLDVIYLIAIPGEGIFF